jgi:MFS family permease
MKKHGEDTSERSATVVFVLCLVQFVDVLGVTEVLAAVPKMLASVSAPPAAASAVLTAYAVCFGGLLMLGARLGDRFGHRRVLLAGLGAFGAGSACAAAAGSATALIAGRSVQGAAAAVSVPAALRLLISATPQARDRHRAMAAWSAAGAVAGASGYVLGGAFAELTGWRAMFWVNLPAALAIAAGVVHCTTDQRPGSRPRIDLPGAVLFTAGVAGLVLGASVLQGGRPGAGLAAGVAGVGLLAALTWVERHAGDPLIPTAALRHRRLRVGAGAAFLNTATTSSAAAIAALQLQRVQHLSPAAAGLRLMPFSLGAIAGAMLAARVLRRLAPQGVVGLGLGLIACGDAALIGLNRSGWLLSVAVGISGTGIGLSSVAATGLGTAVGESLQATAAGVVNTAAQLGTALGVAMMLLVATATAHAGIPIRGDSLGWAAAAALAMGGALALGGARRVSPSGAAWSP